MGKFFCVLRLSAVVGALSVLTCAGADITITNPSFEADVLNCAGGPTCYDVGVAPGWNATTFKPSTGPGGEFPGGVPDGVNVLAVGDPSVNQTASQTLTAILSANTVYTLTIYVGQRADTPLSGYAVSLEANGVVLASDSSLQPASGKFLLDTVTYTSGSNPAELGKDLAIDLFSSGGGAQVVFDDVKLSADPASAPEPAFLLPFGILALGVMWSGFRKVSS
jgi:hypothetical protein